MKRIGVISDTHISRMAHDLSERICSEFHKVDMIFHAGDLTDMSVLEKLRSIAPTHAVYGNMDPAEVRAALPQKEVIQVDGFKIGLIHGYGPPSGILKAVSTEFTGVDAIVFGHSHAAFNEKIKGVLFFNPGSPTDKIFATANTFGILEVGESGITGRIVKL